MFFFSPRPISAADTAAVVIILAIFFASTFATNAILANDEVEALEEIGKSLGKDWNFSVDPCSGQKGWAPSGEKSDNYTVSCIPPVPNDNFSHVVTIVMKEQNLNGRLPPELVKLPYLQEIDLTRNYLNGTLPPEWGSMKHLKILAVIGNRLTGPIPKEYGNIKTLEQLELEANQLSGAIPPELGNLTAIQQLNLRSNNFTGELPHTLANLINLTQFRISDNYFKGKIPNFVQQWTKLEILEIQASGLDGPIPSRLDSLTSLKDLRISDLNGTEGEFPSLNNSKSIETLILRSCNIKGELPDYLGGMKQLRTLDLSFNRLGGTIPNNFRTVVENLEINYIDLSYNNFTPNSSGGCQQGKTNLFGSSSKSNPSGTVSCLGTTTCSKLGHSFYINCGGPRVSKAEDGHPYDDDRYEEQGTPKFFQPNWVFSSTGHFVDNSSKKSYISRKDSESNNNTLWMDARLSPLSLTYYGFCLENGKYIVNLFFEEIEFAGDQTYSSLGRRIFDVYIQGKREWKDFNIEDEAGVGNRTKKTFNNISVTNHTLEIRFYWAGRGTTIIPVKGVYGPLISAISVEKDDEGSVSVGTVVGIVVGVSSAIFLVLGILWWKGCFHRKDTKELELKGLDLQTGSFTLRQIRAATSNFDNSNKIGEGGFGPVYKGILSDGTIIAVKQLSSKSKQGNREFVNEIGMISALQHPHLVKLYGCCIEGNELLLVYEYLENNSLARALFGPKEHLLKLDWPTRHKICIGIARGLAYLHEESRLKIVHRDIKATNVLLDKDLNAKISDFGLAKLDEEENTHISTRIAGTFGYMAPEYAMRGYLTDKADVYSFGIVALEIVSGRSNTSSRPKQEPFYLLDWALELKDKGNLMELVDERLGSKFNEEEVTVMINLGILCANASPTARPAMSSVVSILEGRAVIQEFVSDQSVKIDMNKKPPMEMKDEHQQSYVTSSGDTQVQSVSISDSWTASSTSTADLYPVNFDSEYWKQRPESDASSDSPLIPLKKEV